MKYLTKDAAALLYTLYSQYLSRRKVGIPRSEAKEFGSAETIKEDFNLQAPVSDVTDSMWELSRAGYLVTLDCEDGIEQCELTNDAIIDCDNIAADKVHALVGGLVSLSDFVSKFIH